MLQVSDLCALSPAAFGTKVHVGGVLLGGRFDNLVIADSIESFDEGAAVPLLDDSLIERLVACGVFPVGGGRFGFRNPCVIEGELAPSARGYKYSLKNIVSLNVNYDGKDRLILPVSEPEE